MKTNLVLVKLSVIILCSSMLYGGGRTSLARSEGVDEVKYEKAISLVYNYDLLQADQLLDDVIAMDPKNPKSFFFKAVVYWWYYISDINNKNFETEFLSRIQQAIRIAELHIKTLGEDPETLFYLGANYGYLARYYVMTNSWLKASYYGKKGKTIFSELLEKDTTLYDAYLGLGVYNYYADQLPKLVKFLLVVLGISGDKTLGIYQLNIAADSGRYSRTEALGLLGYLNLQFENDYEKSINIFIKLANQYPLNPIFKMSLAESYRKSTRYDEAIGVYQHLLFDKTIKYVSNNQLAQLQADIGFTYMLAEDYSKAVQHYRESENLGTNDFFVNSVWIYYNFGRCEEKMENFDNALRYYQKVLECGDYFDYHSRARVAIKRISDRKRIAH